MPSTTSPFLLAYYDQGLPIRAEDTEAKISRVEQDRVRKLLAMAVYAQGIPRRLGPDSSPDDLASDKLRAKRIAHVAEQLVRAWGSRMPNGASAEVKREAAAMDWKTWYDTHRIDLMNRQRYIATWCIKQQTDEKWAKSAITKITNEIAWLEHALR